jgi:hypothetical protein
MNNAELAGVKAPTRVVFATVVCLVVHASCTDVSGGAVELSWLLRPSNGDENACENDQSCCQASRVERMRLVWEVDGTTGFDSWPCADNRAVTGFDVPPGQAQLSVVPECAGGVLAQPALYEAPAPVVRTLITGEVVSLNAVLVQVQISDCMAQPCICR